MILSSDPFLDLLFSSLFFTTSSHINLDHLSSLFSCGRLSETIVRSDPSLCHTYPVEMSRFLVSVFHNTIRTLIKFSRFSIFPNALLSKYFTNKKPTLNHFKENIMVILYITL